jgi:hypothetical protein
VAHWQGLKLRCKDGHFEMAAFDLKPVGGAFWMWVACDFGGASSGHWLAPDPHQAQHVIVIATPYAWPSAVAAFAARDRWEAQEASHQPASSW